MKKSLLISFLLLFGSISYAQYEYADIQSTARAGVGTTFSEDYNAIGINASNLAKKPFFFGKDIVFGFLAFNTSVFTAPLSKAQLFDAIGGGASDFTYADKVNYALQFISEPITINHDQTIFGAYYHHRKIGGFAFSVRDRMQWYSSFDDKTSDLLFLGYNSSYFNQVVTNDNGVIDTIANASDLTQATRDLITSGLLTIPDSAIRYSDIIGNTQISIVAYREYNFGFGREIYDDGKFKFLGGFSARYIEGYNMSEISNRDGQFQAYGAFSPYLDIDFGAAANSNPNAVNSKSFGTGPNVLGRGYGFDLGLTFVYKERTNIGLALNNIGSITWNKNTYQAVNDELIDLTNSGFESFNFFEEVQKFGGDDGLFNWEPGQSKTIALPSNFRAGFSQEIGDVFHLGADVIVPLNTIPGSIADPVFAVGGDFTPLRVIKISSGFTYGGNFDTRLIVPAGLSLMFGEGTYEMGFATRDIVTYFRQKGPVLSAGLGFFKFRI